MRPFAVAFLISASIGVMADSARSDEHVIIKTDDHHGETREKEKSDSQVFCSKKSEEEASLKCKEWLAQQLRTLGERVLTSHCSDGEISTDGGCLYRSRGEVKFVLKGVSTNKK